MTTTANNKITTPVGRLVMGSLYIPQTTNAVNQPLVIKSGPNAGQPRTDYFFALAIQKGTEQHWSQTEWGALIWNIGHTSFPGGQANSPAFAWKVVDGDSTVVNSKGKKPCEREGYPGHWVLHFSSGFSPTIYNADGTQQLLEEDAVKLGDYIQVYAAVAGNESPQMNPGLFLNHKYVAFSGYGQRITIGPDAGSVGFGGTLPAGASPIPLAQGFNPAHTVSAQPATVPVMSPAAIVYTPPTAPITPYPGILNPPQTAYAPAALVPPPLSVPPQAPVAPKHVMLPKAGGHSYEQLIDAGWTDALLIQHEYMQA